jgi:hypothetical protein
MMEIALVVRSPYARPAEIVVCRMAPYICCSLSNSIFYIGVIPRTDDGTLFPPPSDYRVF